MAPEVVTRKESMAQGGYLVLGHYGDRDGGRRAALPE